MNRLKEKVMVITGAASGIGKASAILAAREGAKLVMLDIQGEKLQETEKEICSSGGEAIAITGSVDRDEDVAKLLKTAIDRFGHVDIAVNDAGILRNNEGAVNISDEDTMALFETNAMGTLRVVREALKYMLPQKHGTFVTVGSTGGVLGHGGAAYALTKGGQVMLTRQVAFDYHLEGIRSNAVCPDGVDTPLIRNENGWLIRDAHTTASCMKHSVGEAGICSAEQVANVVIFLASDESSGINGQAIICDRAACI